MLIKFFDQIDQHDALYVAYVESLNRRTDHGYTTIQFRELEDLNEQRNHSVRPPYPLEASSSLSSEKSSVCVATNANVDNAP